MLATWITQLQVIANEFRLPKAIASNKNAHIIAFSQKTIFGTLSANLATLLTPGLRRILQGLPSSSLTTSVP
jgi:hypothetical protein